MATTAREIVICVDMGMIGSAARWHDSLSKIGWTPTSEKKIPTKVAYDPRYKDGPPIAWGDKCDTLPCIQVKEYFKTFIGATTFASEAQTIPGGPASQEELDRWVCDYLTAFCTDIVVHIDKSAAAGWRDARVTWNFTVPGCWAAFPVSKFAAIAQKAVSSCLQNDTDPIIFTNTTEGMASAQCLLITGSAINKEAYSLGNVVVSCDLGGATTDIAVSTVYPRSSVENLETRPQLETRPIGTVTIDSAFWLHAQDTLKSAGVQNPDYIALEMARGENFKTARGLFTQAQIEDRILIRLPFSCNLRNWSPPGPPSTNVSVIENGFLCIHKKQFASFYTEFVEQIEAAIDEAITAAAKERYPTIIGFCGGGSRTAYALEYLGLRYRSGMSIIDYRELAIEPEMATVIGSTLIQDQIKLQNSINQTSLGIKTSNGMSWSAVDRNKEPSISGEGYSPVVYFYCERGWAKSDSHSHQIIAAPTTPSLPIKYSDGRSGSLDFQSKPADLQALALPNARSWTVEVDLSAEKAPAISLHRKYKIVCDVAGPREVAFSAKSLDVSGREIPCKVIA